jgi:hypothetical protein
MQKLLFVIAGLLLVATASAHPRRSWGNAVPLAATQQSTSSSSPGCSWSR